MYILYSLLLALAVLISLPWWIFQMLRLGKYRAGLRERMGLTPARVHRAAKAGSIWIHAVSVGEVLAVSRLVTELRQLFPAKTVFVSTTTAAAQQLARERFGEEHVFFMPLDFTLALKPYLAALRPSLLVLAETEFWPNLLHCAKATGAAVAIVNARISDRSFPRYRKFSWFFARVLADVDLFLAQTEDDARRLRVIGAPAERVQVSGNLKFDVRPGSASSLVEDLRRTIGGSSQIIVCGSTSAGEEELLLRAFIRVQQDFPRALMVLAPRHPERFDQVASLIDSMGIPLVRRSSWLPGQSFESGVFLLDSVGELSSIYGLADVAFVGGSLVPTGGHNILEPARHGVAILTGPHTFNFREIVKIFQDGGAIRIVSADNLAADFLELLHHEAKRADLGRRARELFLENAGATQKTLQALAGLLQQKSGKP